MSVQELRKAARTLRDKPLETILSPDAVTALADWLDTAGADEWAHGPHCQIECDDCDDDPRAPHVRRALHIARLINGSTP